MAEAIEQARHDAAGNVPVICHRTNRTPWLVTVELEELPQLVRVLGKLVCQSDSLAAVTEDMDRQNAIPACPL